MSNHTFEFRFRPLTRRSFVAGLALSALVATTGSLGVHAAQPQLHAGAKGTIRLADKGFTEEYLIADMYQLLLQKNGFTVDRHSFTSTSIAQQAITHNQIDLYPEYTGTGYSVVLGQTQVITNPTKLFKQVKSQYQSKFKLTWLKQSPMNDSQAVAVTQATANKYHIKTLTDLGKASSKLTAVVLAECVGRPDCLKGLQDTYHVNFHSVRKTTSTALNYQALLNGQADVSEVFTTDAQIAAHHLVVPTDDKHLFPPYHVAPVIRDDTLAKYPQIKSILNNLAHLITTTTMQKLNGQVDLQHQDHMTVAKNFLQQNHML